MTTNPIIEAIARQVADPTHDLKFDHMEPFDRAFLYEEVKRFVAAAARAGYVLVPKEPTQEMLEASYAKERKICPGGAYGLNHSVIYECLLAAAPRLTDDDE